MQLGSSSVSLRSRRSSIESLKRFLLTDGALGGSGRSTHSRASGLCGHLGGQAGGEDTGGSHCVGCEGRRCGGGGVGLEVGDGKNRWTEAQQKRTELGEKEKRERKGGSKGSTLAQGVPTGATKRCQQTQAVAEGNNFAQQH